MKGSRGGKFSRLSKTDLAEARGVSLNTVYGWVRQGVPKNKNGTFDLRDVSEWLAKRGASKVGSREKERARLAREQADKLEMENAQTRGELVHVDDAAAAVCRCGDPRQGPVPGEQARPAGGGMQQRERGEGDHRCRR
jgi:phage terminase Nu1 subunit (DNA packaging protein)